MIEQVIIFVSEALLLPLIGVGGILGNVASIAVLESR